MPKAKVKEISLVKAIRTNHYPTLLFADDDVVTEKQMKEACDAIEMLSYPDQRNQMKIQDAGFEKENELVNQLLRGRGAEYEQKRLLHNMKYTD